MSAILPIHFWITTLVALATGGFAWRQNRGGLVGGPIAPVKAAWLAFALIMFYVVPGTLAASGRHGAGVRLLFGAVLVSFVLRGAIELWLLYARRGWKCIYGVSHDLAMAVVVLIGWRLAAGNSAMDARALWFAQFLIIVLIVEAWLANGFSKLASPADGTYFADHSPRFRHLIVATRRGAPRRRSDSGCVAVVDQKRFCGMGRLTKRSPTHPQCGRGSHGGAFRDFCAPL